MEMVMGELKGEKDETDQVVNREGGINGVRLGVLNIRGLLINIRIKIISLRVRDVTAV
jgi:hypothetical protein|tara:strand:+ start:654 stop:827 length:174 start_codon:yes stop_codon:yes gene_type:complete